MLLCRNLGILTLTPPLFFGSMLCKKFPPCHLGYSMQSFTLHSQPHGSEISLGIDTQRSAATPVLRRGISLKGVT